MTIDRRSSSPHRPVLQASSSPEVKEVGPSSSAPPQAAGEKVRLQIWMRRALVLSFVVGCAVTGVLLVVLPWSLQWTANPLLWAYPELRAALGNGFVRGICSGFGVLNLWIGFQEAVHYNEGRVP